MTTLRWMLCLIGLGMCAALTHAQTPPKTDPPATASVSGRVMLDRQPVAGVRIEVGTGLGAARTGPDGTYRITSLPPGKLYIRARTGIYVEDVPIQERDGRFITLDAGENAEGFDIRLVAGGVVTGHVRDRDNRPIVNARLEFYVPVEDGSGRPIDTGIGVTPRPGNILTDDRGEYRAFGVPPGRYLVQVWTGQHPITYYPNADDPTGARTLVVKTGEVREDIDIIVPDPYQTFSVTGRLVDADTGAPVPGELVAFSPAPVSGGQFSGPLVRADRDGKFRGDRVRPGRYRLTVRTSNSELQYPDSRLFNDPVPIEITDHDMTDVVVKVQKGATFSGKVEIDGDSGPARGFAGWRVSAAIQTDGNFQIGTMAAIASDGGFQVVGVKPGRYRPMVFPPNDSGLAASVTGLFVNGVEVTQTGLEVGKEPIREVRIVVRLDGGALRGEVRFTGDRPFRKCTVFIVSPNGEATARYLGETDERGHFAFTKIPPGTYRILIGPPVTNGQDNTRFTTTPSLVTVPETGAATVQLTVTAPAGEGSPR